jgi:hypothetical protein
MHSGLVLLTNMKDFTIWDYDHGLYKRILCFSMNCWPVKMIACHGVGSAPSIFTKMLKRITNALMDKHTRCRVLQHNVPVSQIPDVLSHYGIMKYMLPAEMGGTVKFDLTEWIASRRAAELEEI